MRTITVYYSDGHYHSTNINGTDEEIRAYYVGRVFNVGDGAGGDRMLRALFVDFLDRDYEFRLKEALKAVVETMNSNDISAEKTHPWIPGMDAKPLKKYLSNVLAIQEQFSSTPA